MAVKHRGNGQGTAIKVKTNCWKAIAVVGYKPDGNPVRRTKSGFKTKTEALAYIPYLKKEKTTHQSLTFREVYDMWLESYKGNITRSTLYCYIGGFKVFEDYWYFKIDKLNIDDLQDCIDSCEHGYRTKQNAKTVLGLIFKYAIPRGYAESNLSEYIKVRTDDKTEKCGFTAEQLETIRQNIKTVPYADIIYCHCLTGFRPSEFMELKVKDYCEATETLVGGAKTDAGKNRTVTVSPKIKPIVDVLRHNKNDDEQLFAYSKQLTYRKYKEHFYKALSEMGIQDESDHTLSPHSCRHTFATLIKNISAPDTDKMKLIGHSSAEMLRYYQDSGIEDLRKITNML